MTIKLPDASDLRTPLGNFAFHVAFETEGTTVPVEPFGAFSEISGLEATMEHKVIKEGGRNYGPSVRIGQVSFATVILKRGIVEVDNLWNWWSLFTGADGQSNGYPGGSHGTNRCDVLIGMIGLRPFKPEPDKAKEGEYHYKDTRDTMFGKATVQVDAYNTFGRKPAEPPKPIDPIPEIRAVWRLRDAMPVKFRAGDLNAKGSDIAVEELHLVHEGLVMEKPSQ
jgi:phage tail-like protein